MKDIIVASEHDTSILATKIGQILKARDCLVLTGELGAGKTTLTKGLAKGMGIDQMIKSPTYTIVKEYRQGRLPLFHMDVYRLAEGGTDLGLEEYFESDGVSIVEWGQLISAELPVDYVEITLTYQAQESQRLLAFRAVGNQGQELLQRIAAVI